MPCIARCVSARFASNNLPVLTLDEAIKLFQNRAALGTIPLEITDLRLARGATLAGSGAFITAKRTVAAVSVPALIGGDTNGSVPHIQIESPYLLLIRDKTGRFNVSDLVPPAKKGEKPSVFRTVIDLADARVTFRDFAAKFAAPLLPAVNQLTLPHAQVDLRQTRRILFDIAARGAAGTLTADRIGGLAKISGNMERGTPGEYPDAPPPDGRPLYRSRERRQRQSDLLAGLFLRHHRIRAGQRTRERRHHGGFPLSQAEGI